ncbi:nuclear transport factor 2 family protein [Nocardioides guangzhouensis]|uniref:Nuclear transport factor 2 family protein n=1 Tax=Nocardioides guangzhouensis TaxID=2497878 RepID=A0A4Q4ZJR8_9ACTN|nr:nuclear transport factor 2 family protein [Nocardioides guangzhouensis]RYP88238.1 nuclear transport factor 2 family protein [Nocardioides guangzhouensis]
MATMVERLRDVTNAHDAVGMAALFADDYRSSQPAHPGRAFTGNGQVQENWTSVFAGIPDFASVLVASSIDGDTEWGEWEWHGTHLDGSRFAMCGVMVLRVRDDRVAEARLYMEQVEATEQDIRAAVQELYHPPED